MQHTPQPLSPSTEPLSLAHLSVEAPPVSAQLYSHLQEFLNPLLVQLDAKIDSRLARTFLATIAVLLQHRHRNNGLLLSELGGCLLPPAHAPAGTKRLSNLLRCRKWSAKLIEHFLWKQAQNRLEQLQKSQQESLVLWDESVIEKPESLALEGLCAVRSAKAKRLKRIKPGYYNPPGGRPIFVPGWQWITLLLMGTSGPPTVAAMRWWSNRGPQATETRTVQTRLLRQCARCWKQKVCHVFDRGYAGSPWLGLLFKYQVRFIVRWPKYYHLQDLVGCEAKAWQLARGKRSWEHRLIWDARRRCHRKTGVYALEVRHPHYDQPLWLVISRPGQGKEPWYLLTNCPVATADDAWRTIFAYARRWQIEMCFRYNKSELAMESPRLWEWERRVKLLLMVTLAYAFLLTLMEIPLLCHWLLRNFCHRTGKRNREASIPLYRIRYALSQLWIIYMTYPAAIKQNSG